MKKTCIFLFILIGITSSLCAGVAVQSDAASPETIGVSSSLVLIDARVTDESGNPVPGLRAEDFQLYQDGRLQAITRFNSKRAALGAETRTIVFVIDDLGLSKAKFNQIRTALRYFADKVMRPTDLVAIARTAGGGAVLQPLTSDAAKVRAAANRWQWSVETGRPVQDIVRTTMVSGTGFVESCSGSS